MKALVKTVIALLLLFHCNLNAKDLPYKVYAVKFATSGYPFTAADWAKGGSKSEKVNITFSFWLIKSNNKKILVDAGFEYDIEDAKEFKLTSYTRPDSALLPLNIHPEDITDVIISHPHWDHIDGVNLFPKAHFWIQKDDYNYFVGKAWQKPLDIGGFAKRDVVKLVELNVSGRLTLVNGDNKEIFPGIHVYTGSKHTYGSQYVLVNSANRKIILASDNVWIYSNLEYMLPAAPGGTLDPVAYVNQMKRMKKMVPSDQYIIPGHDEQVYKRFPLIKDKIAELL
ncbi:N-acyl homoserine lactonase family protein [Mucilaginibacter sp. KACC 22063]|uniref:N-acyl homoserine lactonase family protein n=1 Tax=Mucilaginibacter sp. KACC 22063 TaxID=3025666 RepID=UPI002366111C|nr:N-acyl homoserine lactonase family protein [Mucilaginibacter sp. KACC 22063]WDF56877.1 N-acyl homoserine lactonase family protein [Mucilaginibacter sp. KACC 22063]